MKILTYNLNGIRSAMNKNLLGWLQEQKADIVCLQETKAQPDQLDTTLFDVMGYRHYWHSAVKKGYSGVAILSKIEPRHVEIGCGNPEYDNEGRVIRCDYDDFSVMSVYMPSGSSGDHRQEFKMQWLSFFSEYIENLKQEIPNLIICGDYNICNHPIDIHDPKGNAKNSGFLPEEREWLTEFFESGFVDTFRHFNKNPDHYTWWSYRFNSRAKNKGWRIDYIAVSESLKPRLLNSFIHPNAVHSDHCPVSVELKQQL